MLNSDKYKDVGREYKTIMEKLSTINEDIPAKHRIITTNEVNAEHLEKDIDALSIELTLCRK